MHPYDILIAVVAVFSLGGIRHAKGWNKAWAVGGVVLAGLMAWVRGYLGIPD
jgi:hypothetical protein